MNKVRRVSKAKIADFRMTVVWHVYSFSGLISLLHAPFFSSLLCNLKTSLASMICFLNVGLKQIRPLSFHKLRVPMRTYAITLNLKEAFSRVTSHPILVKVKVQAQQVYSLNSFIWKFPSRDMQ